MGFGAERMAEIEQVADIFREREREMKRCEGWCLGVCWAVGLPLLVIRFGYMRSLAVSPFLFFLDARINLNYTTLIMCE